MIFGNPRGVFKVYRTFRGRFFSRVLKQFLGFKYLHKGFQKVSWFLYNMSLVFLFKTNSYVFLFCWIFFFRSEKIWNVSLGVFLFCSVLWSDFWLLVVKKSWEALKSGRKCLLSFFGLFRWLMVRWLGAWLWAKNMFFFEVLKALEVQWLPLLHPWMVNYWGMMMWLSGGRWAVEDGWGSMGWEGKPYKSESFFGSFFSYREGW